MAVGVAPAPEVVPGAGPGEQRTGERYPVRLLPWALAAVFAALYAALSLRRHARFESTGYDLGIFEQGVRAYANGQAPFSHIREIDLLGDHFSPIMALLAPLYRLLPSPETLLVAQAVLFALSMVPVARLCLERVGPLAATATAVAQGLFWGVQEAVWFDVHEVCFAVPLLAFCSVALVRRQQGAAVTWALPLLLVKEDLRLTVAMVGVVVVLQGRRLLGAATAAAGLATLGLVVTVVLPALNPAHRYQYAGTPMVWSATDLGDVVNEQKLVLLASVLGPTLLLAVRSPVALLMAPTLAGASPRPAPATGRRPSTTAPSSRPSRSPPSSTSCRAPGGPANWRSPPRPSPSRSRSGPATPARWLASPTSTSGAIRPGSRPTVPRSRSSPTAPSSPPATPSPRTSFAAPTSGRSRTARLRPHRISSSSTPPTRTRCHLRGTGRRWAGWRPRGGTCSSTATAWWPCGTPDGGMLTAPWAAAMIRAAGGAGACVGGSLRRSLRSSIDRPPEGSMATARSTALATREIVVFVASALVLVASFLSISGDYGISPWHQAFLWLLVLGYLTAVAVGVIVALERFAGTPSPARAVGLSEGQLLGVLSTVSLATLVLTLLSGGSAGGGLILAFLGSVVLFIVTVFGSRIPALAAR